nr:SDR family oxidoreductase [Halobacterium bonnevillei]
MGAAVAKRFSAEGSALVVTGCSMGDGESAVNEITDSGGTAVLVEADMRSSDDIVALFEATVDEFGGIDVLINKCSGPDGDRGCRHHDR